MIEQSTILTLLHKAYTLEQTSHDAKKGLPTYAEIGPAPYYDPYNPGDPCCKRAKEVLGILKKLRDEANAVDYTGKNDVEIFQTVYGRYNKAFGGHYSGALYGGLGVYLRVGQTQWQSVDLWSQMSTEVLVRLDIVSHTEFVRCGPIKLVELESNALFYKMCEGERWARVISKYLGDQTTLEYCCLLREMSVAGLVAKEAASALAGYACKEMYYKAEQKLGIPTEDSFAQVLDYASELMETERFPIEERFSHFVHFCPHRIDQARWKEFLTEFLDCMDKKWIDSVY